MNFRIILLLLPFQLSFSALSAQKLCNLHIVTIPGNLVAPFKFNFDVNGKSFKLKAGHCLELKLATETVNIELKDNRWVKNETIDLHLPAEMDIYVLIKLARNTQGIKGEFYMAEAVCKECFDELKRRCTKEISE